MTDSKETEKKEGKKRKAEEPKQKQKQKSHKTLPDEYAGDSADAMQVQYNVLYVAKDNMVHVLAVLNWPDKDMATCCHTNVHNDLVWKHVPEFEMHCPCGLELHVRHLPRPEKCENKECGKPTKTDGLCNWNYTCECFVDKNDAVDDITDEDWQRFVSQEVRDDLEYAP